MAEESKKNEGPSCACGKGDLYEEWLKNENKKKAANTTDSKETEESKNKADNSGKE